MATVQTQQEEGSNKLMESGTNQINTSSLED